MSLVNSFNNRIIRLTTKYFKAVVVVIIILIIMVGYLTILRGKISSIQSYRVTDYKGKVNEKQEREQYLVGLKDLDSQYKQWKNKDLARIDQVLPSIEDYPGVFSQFEQMTTDAGYSLNELTIFKGSEVGQASATGTANILAPNVKSLNIQMGISGHEGYGYENFKTLLGTIEKNLRLIDIVSLNFSPDQIDFRLNVRTYYLP